MHNLPAPLAIEKLQEELERFCGAFRIDSADINPLSSGGWLLGPFFSRSLQNWAAQLLGDPDRPVERRHFVAIEPMDYGICRATLDLHCLQTKWHRPPVYVALCPYSGLDAACNALLRLANEYLDWRFDSTEALDAHIRYLTEALELTETSESELVEPNRIHQRPYGAAFELIMDGTDHDLGAYFNLHTPPLWKPVALSLGGAGSVQLAFVEGEAWTELPYSQSLVHSGLCAFCCPGVTNERRAKSDLDQWLKEYRQLQSRTRRQKNKVAST